MEEIKLDENNYRIHDERNKQLINKSLKEYGAGRSVLLDKEGVIIAGNGTYEQAKELGIPVKVIETNGTNKVPFWIDWITCSPKSDIDFKAIGRMPDEIKVVYEYGRDKYLTSLIGLGPKLYLQPLEQNGKMNVAEVFDFIKQHPEYRLSLQFHKMLGIR